MTEAIGERLTKAMTTVLGDVKLYYCEAESDCLPFVVYDYTATPRYSKDGIYAYDGAAQIITVADTYDEMHELARAVQAAVLELNGSDGLTVRLTSIADQCQEGIWRNDLYINILQKQ